jgi:hypothetical protein
MTHARIPLDARFWSLLQAGDLAQLPGQPASVLVLHSGLEPAAILALTGRWRNGEFSQIFSFSHTADTLLQALEAWDHASNQWLFIDCISSSVKNPEPKPGIIFEATPSNARQLEIILSGHEPREPYRTMAIDSLSALLDGPLAMDASGQAAIFKELGLLAHGAPGRRLIVFFDERHRDAFTIPLLGFDAIIRVEEISGFG